jgi:hypothetical protein
LLSYMRYIPVNTHKLALIPCGIMACPGRDSAQGIGRKLSIIGPGALNLKGQ